MPLARCHMFGIVRFGVCRVAIAALVCVAMFSFGREVNAGDLNEARSLFRTGKYAECAEMAAAASGGGMDLEAWRRLEIESQLAEGHYADALTAAELALIEDPLSIPLRLLAREAYLYSGQPELAAAQTEIVGELALNARRGYWTPEGRVALGRFFLRQGADARQALEIFYDPVVKAVPEFVDAHLASAELALAKYDQALAADMLDKAPDEAKQDPHYHYLRARAFKDSEPQVAAESLEAALAISPRHVDSLLMQADQFVDAEQYADADKLLDQALEVNSRHPVAWAYKAVLANLDADEAAATRARERALSTWTTNPEVDYTIGRKLSEKYRFAEGAEHQRLALAMDSSYLPARMQLAQDLLRLGQETEGWRLATEAADDDGYNVVAHNLATLHDSLKTYVIVANESFRVRMEPREAAIYGPQALALLDRAKATLSAKYNATLDEPVTVDIYPKSSDFAVRTFGLPGAEGYLGVCFGNVITAKSAAALGGVAANWQSVLWHEFCHVVTLHKSRNKMPRWFSEGISVYEERQANPAWGEKLTPQYREIVVSGEAPKVSELSAAFLAPESPLALQFAYFESSMVVEMLVDEYGVEAIGLILDDLGTGLKVEDALARHAAPINRLDVQFDAYLKQHIAEWGPKVDWAECDLPAEADALAIAAWLEDHSDNLDGLSRLGRAQQRDGQWSESLDTAERLRELLPEYTGARNGYQLAARAHRELGDAPAEREMLGAWAARDGEAVEAYQRLMELGEDAADWRLVLDNAQRMLAVNPLSPSPYRQLAQAAEELNQPAEAETAWRALLEFDTADAVDVHYRLAVFAKDRGDAAAARRQVLQAIEDAPRYLAALELLADLHDAAGDGGDRSESAASSSHD